MKSLNKMRRHDHSYNLAKAIQFRRDGFFEQARKYLRWARFDRDCFERGGWKLP